MCLGTTGVVTRILDNDGVPTAWIDAAPVGEIEACLLTCPEAKTGDTVLVHSGYVLRILKEEE